MKLSFAELPSQFTVALVLQSFGSIFGFPFPSSIDVGSSVPSIRVATPPAQVFLASISYEWEGVIRDHRLVVTSRQNQCFSCLALGHLARDCPKASSRRASRRSFQRQQQSQTEPAVQDRGGASQSIRQHQHPPILVYRKKAVLTAPPSELDRPPEDRQSISQPAPPLVQPSV